MKLSTSQLCIANQKGFGEHTATKVVVLKDRFGTEIDRQYVCGNHLGVVDMWKYASSQHQITIEQVEYE